MDRFRMKHLLGKVAFTLLLLPLAFNTASALAQPGPTTGFIEICKVAGDGVANGTNFTFAIAGKAETITVPAGSAPFGVCSSLIQLPAGTATITETAVTGTVLSAVSTLPSGALISSNLGGGTATVTVTAGGVENETVVIFTNRKVQTGFLEICKVAGAGITQGTNFTFTVGGKTVTVPAGPAPTGFCSPAFELPAGSAVITEAAHLGATLTSVSALPSGRLVSFDLTARTATVTIVPGDISTETLVVFTNQAVLGQLKLCKIAGPGITVGSQFTFTADSTTFTVPAGPAAEGGFCVVDGTFPVGTHVTIHETIPSATQVSAITVAPAARIVGAPDLANGTVTVEIGTGFTEVTFTDAALVPLEQGQLKLCKIAGDGVTAGTNFTFTVGAVSFTVPAGSCVLDGTFTVGTVVTITETAAPNTTVSAISVLPADRISGTANLPGRTVDVTIGTGITEVLFTNVVIPPLPPPGNQGCTPGFWKQPQHFDSWVGFSPSQTVGSVFTIPTFLGSASFASETLLQALQGGGGPGLAGAVQILLRAAVAALLNASNPDVSFPLTTAQVISEVNAALASKDRATILALASSLDALNNGPGGCPLS